MGIKLGPTAEIRVEHLQMTWGTVWVVLLKVLEYTRRKVNFACMRIFFVEL